MPAPVKSGLVDSHCHLNYDGLALDLDAVVGRARAAGIERMLCINTKFQEFEDINDIAERFEDVWATIGVHPHEVADTKNHKNAEYVRRILLAESLRDKVVAFGETGLDYYYEHSPRELQQEIFDVHLAVAAQVDLPIIIHTRDAEEDTVRMLNKYKGQVRGVIHCFSGTQYLADECLDLGLYISVSGILTFKKSEAIREVIKNVPLSRLLVETDAPYLAPEPHRGKPNEPSWVVHTAKCLAELKGISYDEVVKATTNNFYDLFRKVSEPE